MDGAWNFGKGKSISGRNALKALIRTSSVRTFTFRTVSASTVKTEPEEAADSGNGSLGEEPPLSEHETDNDQTTDDSVDSAVVCTNIGVVQTQLMQSAFENIVVFTLNVVVFYKRTRVCKRAFVAYRTCTYLV